jgi:KipI family sensor histidine kinase inhibitor
MQLILLGDCAVLVVFKAKSSVVALELVARSARALNVAPMVGITDIVPAFTTITVHYDPAQVAAGGGPAGAPVERVMAWIKSAPAPSGGSQRKAAREVIVPVCYGGEQGPDLPEVATRTKLTEAEVIRLHTKASYRVAAVGFSPGFPYLLGLPERLATPRRETPRLSVPAGSVGIGGSQTGVYPTATPGGWSIIGRTPLRLFRPENETAPTLLKAGDTVKFVSITESRATQLEEKPVALTTVNVSRATAVFEIIKPGVLTTVQDLGRTGWQHHGVPVGGPMDRQAARVANILLGNDENAPLLEATHTGPELKFFCDTWIAVTGAEIRDVPGWRPIRVKSGQVVVLTEMIRGARAYIAVLGGLEIARVMGSASTLLRPGMGGWNGRALQAGDRLGARPGAREIIGGWSASADFKVSIAPEVIVRVLRGPQWNDFTAASRRAFLGKRFKITVRSDRMGLRLEGTALRAEKKIDLASEGVGFGSVQVPPDGNPIVLMADRQTIGGYPKIGHVIAVDLPRLAQARTGDIVRFQEITIEEAQALYLEQERALGLLVSGVRSKLVQG